MIWQEFMRIFKMYNLLKLQDVCMNLNRKSIKTRKKQPTNKAYDKKKSHWKKADISWFLQATKLRAIAANSCTVSTLAQQMESSSGSFLVVSEGETQNASLPVLLPACKSGSHYWCLVIWPRVYTKAKVAKAGGILPRVFPDNSLKPEAIRRSHQKPHFKAASLGCTD